MSVSWRTRNDSTLAARQRVIDANQRLADAVGDHLAGQQAASRLIEQIEGDVGLGDELANAIRDLKGRPDSYAKGFSKIIQKFLAAGAN